MHDHVDLPVTVITGFLGSGKTTLINKLIHRPGMADSAIIINEFGQVCLDHNLTEAIADEMLVMRSGCHCCTLRGDLADSLCALLDRRRHGTAPPFDRVIFETTGLADPAPIIQTLICHPIVSASCRLEGVLTVVDAVNGTRNLNRHPESVKQVAMADRLVFTKTDMVDADATALLRDQVSQINPRAELLVEADADAVLAEHLLGTDPLDAGSYIPDLDHWLGRNSACAETRTDGNGGRLKNGWGHDNHIRSYALELEQPIDWSMAREWLGELIGCHGEDLLRVKGLLNVAGVDTPVVIHGVQHLFHQPVPLPAWPSEDHRSRIVFVVRDIDRAEIEPGFRACVADEIISV